MLPVTFLEINHKHRVLDMCAVILEAYNMLISLGSWFEDASNFRENATFKRTRESRGYIL